MKRLLIIHLFVGILATSRPTRAEDSAVVSAARELAMQGFKAYHEGRYEEAAEKSLTAYQMVRVPTLAVNLARSLAQLGKLAQAAELYLEAMGLRPAEEPWQDVQYEAQANAERERNELLPRIPRLKLVIEGADPAQVAVSVDNKHVAVTRLTSEHLIDPGECTVIGRRGNEEMRFTVLAKEADRPLVKMSFRALDQGPNKRAMPVASPTPTPAKSSPQSSPRTTSTPDLLGWGGVALGGVGIVFGSIEGLSAKSKRDELLAGGRCPDGRNCDPSVSADVDSLMMRRTLSTIGFVAGGALAAAGVTILLWPSTRESSPAVALTIGPGFLGVRGGLK